MGTLFQDDTSTTLKCPNCGKYISADTESCRFCSFDISPETRQAGVEKETAVIRKSQFDFYKSMLWVGIFIFIGGAGVTALDILPAILAGKDAFTFWPPIIAIVGLGQVIYSLYHMYKEKRRK